MPPRRLSQSCSQDRAIAPSQAYGEIGGTGSKRDYPRGFALAISLLTGCGGPETDWCA